MIESLHSPHIARVKALIGSKGAKERREQGLFVAEGVQCAREALTSASGPEIKIIYATEQGMSKIAELDLGSVEIIEVSEPVLKAMSDTVSPQGLISLCYTPESNISDLTLRVIQLLFIFMKCEIPEMRELFFAPQMPWVLLQLLHHLILSICIPQKWFVQQQAHSGTFPFMRA